jgi:glycosyltransferase involved in cell wall biosynthesis
MHYCEQSQDDNKVHFSESGVRGMLLRYREQYSTCHADVTIAPSRYALNWMRANNWKPKHVELVPHLFTNADSVHPSGIRRISELCFVGCLETEKGIELYCESLGLLQEKRPELKLPQLTFLGSLGRVGDKCGKAYIETFARERALQVSILHKLDDDAATEYLVSRHGCLAVIPSLTDSLPFVVIACLQNQVSVIASDVGGASELIASPEHLFAPHPRVLAEVIQRMVTNGVPPMRSAYDPQQAKRKWQEILGIPKTHPVVRSVNPEDVTVCIAYYNHAADLPEVFDSLKKQTVSGFQVVVVDDGSSDKESQRVFNVLRKAHIDNANYTFVQTENRGPSEARNLAVAHATTDYIVFMDADNIATDIMIETMTRAMSLSNADCLTGYCEAFRDGEDGSRKVVWRFLPTGACISAGLFMNPFGDTNCIVSKAAFVELGGFLSDRKTSVEDWQLFARLCLSGKELDVIPEFLQYYRLTREGTSRNVCIKSNHMRILKTYESYVSSWASELLSGVYAAILPDINNRTRKQWAQPAQVCSPPTSPEVDSLLRRAECLLSGRFESADYVRRYYNAMSDSWARHPKCHYMVYGFQMGSL